MRPHAQAGSRGPRETALPSRILTASAMHHIIHDSQSPKSHAAARPHPHRLYCEPQQEVLAHALGTALKRCLARGRMEAA